MDNNLPPLNSLITFEAAARLSSFKSAADILHLTPAAVAYQIRKLEDSLNIKLFDRLHKGVALNKAGKLYFETISRLLTELANQTRQFKVNYGQSSLTVLTLHAIAEKWLMPRLVHYRENNPGINIEIKATDNLEKPSANDIVIGFSLKKPKKPNAYIFLEEEIFPVCSDSYLNKTSVELLTTTLSEYELLFDSHWKQDWNLWLKQNHISTGLNPNPGFSFSLYSMVIKAAVEGMGIMMGHRQLISKELEEGTLRSVFSHTQSVIGYYYLVKSEQQPNNAIADQFNRWVIQQAHH